jgi:hypothetical protein
MAGTPKNISMVKQILHLQLWVHIKGIGQQYRQALGGRGANRE